MNTQLDVSVVVPLHHEGRLFHRTQQSIIRSINHAIQNGITAEVILVLDNANSETAEFVVQNPFPKNIKCSILVGKNSNPGLTRNQGVAAAQGESVALVDGDNLFSENWLTEGVTLLKETSEDIVVHPQYLVAFGVKQYVWEIIGSNHPNFDPYALAEQNYWDTMCITRTTVLRRFPHDPARTSEGLGYEDWHWNCQTLAAGIEHLVAEKTSFFYRAKAEESMLLGYTANSTLMPSTEFLKPKVIDSYYRKNKINERVFNSTEDILSQEELPKMRKPIRSAILWTIRKSGKYPYKVTGLISKMHHRVRIFEYTVRPSLQELVRPPGNPPQKTKRQSLPKHNLPQWLIDDWRNIHYIEPSIFPSKYSLPYIHRHSINSNIYTELYWKTVRKIGENQDYIILVPWLKKGGADLEVINYVQAIKNLNPQAKVTIIATNNTTSPWRKLLPDNVKFFTLDKRIHNLAQEHQVHLLGTVLLQMGPKRIHVINSPLGYLVLKKYSKPLSKVSRLFLLIFCLDHTDEGQRVHYVIQYLDDIINNLTKVFADNKKVTQELIDLYNFSPEKFSVHYQPFHGDLSSRQKTRDVPQKFNKKRPLRVLWAGRLDTQKRPDILIEISKKVSQLKLPVEFHVYGSSHLSGAKYKRIITESTGISYHGPYDKGLSSLPLNNFDVFLLTSQWEGMPNVMLEATTGQLPVIAPAVGGIDEFILQDKTGYLVRQFDNVDEYIEVFKSLLNDYAPSQIYLKNAQKLMASRHTRKEFQKQLKAEKDYI